MEVYDNEKDDNTDQPEGKQSRKAEGRKHRIIMSPSKAITTLLFIIAILYVFGLVWVSIAGANAPIGLQFWYPFIPGIGG